MPAVVRDVPGGFLRPESPVALGGGAKWAWQTISCSDNLLNMSRAYYSDSIANFMRASSTAILGELSQNSGGTLKAAEISAWNGQIRILKSTLSKYTGTVHFEYSIPRMGERIDVVLLIGPVIFVLEFKVGAENFSSGAIEQVWDYALDLKNFHKPSHDRYVVPVLIPTQVRDSDLILRVTPQNDKLLYPVKCTPKSLGAAIDTALKFARGDSKIITSKWERGDYCPTPTIIEAAMALYRGHSVAEISRSDASAKNLHQTTAAISQVIRQAKKKRQKAICFVTGVPGAGKTLIGLNIATKHLDNKNDMYSVLLSGNGPLVQVLQEALARDKIQRETEQAEDGQSTTSKQEALSQVKAFVQNVHHYRDACLNSRKPPIDHVALFDEAQRAWDLEQTANFMRRKKNRPNFKKSEPEFLISCIDRHKDWGVVVCLVGGGQEINTGEAGIGEWIEALNRSFPKWHIHISNRLTDSEYGAGKFLHTLKRRSRVRYHKDLHLSVSMRSFRAENVSLLVKQILDMKGNGAQRTFRTIHNKYPIVITRSLKAAKKWLKDKARGSERYGIVVSSSAERLRPHAIHVKAEMNPVHWFLAGREDVRSSFYLEDVATEFSIQGLELDWACVTWDGDFRYGPDGWSHHSFVGDRWNNVNLPARQTFLKNAYRVLLTRARQGMVIVVPRGDPEDPTRAPAFYDPTYKYLKSIGFPEI